MKKTILAVLAMGALSCAVFSQQAQAAQITGTIRLVGGVHIDNNQLGLATTVVTWFDLQLNPGHSTVLTGDGDFSSIAPGTQADMFNGWDSIHLLRLQVYGVLGVLRSIWCRQLLSVRVISSLMFGHKEL
jgi:hypothetical protein